MSTVFNFTFVPWFRSVAPYIHKFRHQTFVIGLTGVAIAAGKLASMAQDIARILHERIPEAERPELGTWLQDLRADPSKAPKALAPYLGAPASTGSPSTTAPPPQPPP